MLQRGGFSADQNNRSPLRGSDTAMPHRFAAAAEFQAVSVVTRTAEPQRSQPEPTQTDPRWVVAVQTSRALQGPILTADARIELLRLGASLGLRPFETSLIIAMVQDQARSGGSLYKMRHTLDLIPSIPAVSRPFSEHVALCVFAVIAAEFMLFWILL